MQSNLPPELEKVYFCDNLDCQIQEQFLNLLKTVNCFRWLLPSQSTSETQPVDAGLGRLVKLHIAQEFESWLEIDENLELWENGKLSASEKRILVTKFVGSAWDKIFLSGKYKPTCYFQKTGCMLTLDGSEDDLVNIEGCPEYKPPKAPSADDVDDGEESSEPIMQEVLDAVPECTKEPKVDSDVTDDEQFEIEEE